MATSLRTSVRWVWTVWVAVLLAVPSSAHRSSAPRLTPSMLEQGLHVGVNHPRVIRNSAAFDISVSVQNLAGEDGVTVREIRTRLPAPFATRVTTVSRRLDSKRQTYLRHLELEEQLESALDRNDADALERVYEERIPVLAELARGGFSSRIHIDPAMLPSSGDLTLRIEVDVLERTGLRTIERELRIPIQPPLPTGVLPGSYGEGADAWLAGDQHLHTTYSIDAAILEGTGENVGDYAAVADAGGLAWIIVTDHSNIDFHFNESEWYTPQQFADGTAEAAAYTAANDFLALNGQEMGAGSSFLLGMPSHYLAYPALFDSTGFIENPCSGYVVNFAFCEDQQTIIDRVAAAGGIGFISHPTDRSPAYVPWNFASQATGWSGMEIWTGDYSDSDLSAHELWHDKLREVRRPVDGSLRERPDYPTRFPVALGNSDAHTPAAIGRTFTYAQMADLSRPNVIEALLSGRAVASNGPLLFGELNGAGLGAVAPDHGSADELNITLQTTPEFGPVGDYTITVHVNGTPRVVIPPSRSSAYFATFTVDGLDFAIPDKFVTLRADSIDGSWRAFTNPIWLGLAPCVGDVNDDGVVEGIDLLLVLLSFGACVDCPTDINGDGVVNLQDVLAVIANAGECGGQPESPR